MLTVVYQWREGTRLIVSMGAQYVIDCFALFGPQTDVSFGVYSGQHHGLLNLRYPLCIFLLARILCSLGPPVRFTGADGEDLLLRFELLDTDASDQLSLELKDSTSFRVRRADK